MAHEKLKQPELSGAEQDLFATASNYAAVWIQSQIPYAQLWRLSGGFAARYGPKSSEKLLKRKRLRHVVVCADIESLDDVRHIVTRTEKQDWSLVSALSQAVGNLEAINPRKHQIQDDGVEVETLGHFEGITPVMGNGNSVVLFLQTSLQEFRHLLLVVYYQNVHDSLSNHGILKIN